ncbi:hypothetical protein ACFWN1_05750 [Streptomyces sp. NPDC058459]|uniref:hypothetical protein n=1 Tax=Streptomyces sp. NPDC058459 TaxID=3346508 RepID=UPI00365655F3
MKAILFGSLFAVLLLWTPALPLAATALAHLAQPAVIAFVAGLAVRPALGRQVRGWTA